MQTATGIRIKLTPTEAEVVASEWPARDVTPDEVERSQGWCDAYAVEYDACDVYDNVLTLPSKPWIDDGIVSEWLDYLDHYAAESMAGDWTASQMRAANRAAKTAAAKIRAVTE